LDTAVIASSLLGASMTTDDIEEIKTALAAMKEREAPTRRSTMRFSHQG
jgi:hypothetical protein